jgi:Uma2 family endonuclease
MRELQLVTADELMRMPEDNWTYELAQGRLIQMSKPGLRHGLVVMRLCTPLVRFVEEHALGVVLPQDTGFLLAAKPDTVRGPDVSFITGEHLAAVASVRGFIPGAPDLAAEVRSPNDRWTQLVEKATDYILNGSRLVWLIDPDRKLVAEFRPGSAASTLTTADVLDGADVVPGFNLPVSRLFDPI